MMMRDAAFGEFAAFDDESESESPAVALPEDLVTDVLDEAGVYTDFAEDLLDEAAEFHDEVRRELDGDIQSLDDGPALDSVAAVDGSYDTVQGVSIGGGLASAVTAGDGFQHEVRQFASPPSQHVSVALQGVSTMLEMKLIAEADSEMIIYDGSFISALVRANQLLGRRSEEGHLSLWDSVDPLLEELYDEDYLYDAIGNSPVAAVPKRTHSTRVLDEEFPTRNFSERYSDQSFFTQILKPGEYYLDHYPQQQATNYGRDSMFISDGASSRVEDLFDRGFYVCLFRPKPWTRAYRLEIPNTSATSGSHEEMLQTFRDTLVDPQMVEPYPQWLADAMAKKVADLTDVLQDKAQSQLAGSAHGPTDVNALFRGYRTENL